MYTFVSLTIQWADRQVQQDSKALHTKKPQCSKLEEGKWQSARVMLLVSLDVSAKTTSSTEPHCQIEENRDFNCRA